MRPRQRSTSLDLRADAHHRVERRHRLLEDHRHVAAAPRAPSLARLSRRDRRRARRMRRAVMCSAGGSRPMIDSASTLLPLPDSPTMPSTSPGATVEGHIVENARPRLDARPGGRSVLRPRARLASLVVMAGPLTRPSISARRNALHPHARIEHIAQAIAEQVQPKHRDHDRQARERSSPRARSA